MLDVGCGFGGMRSGFGWDGCCVLWGWDVGLVGMVSGFGVDRMWVWWGWDVGAWILLVFCMDEMGWHVWGVAGNVLVEMRRV